MLLQKYKMDVILELVFILVGPFLQIINVDISIVTINFFKSPKPNLNT